MYFTILAENLIKEAREGKFKIAFAESCTGGLIGATVTKIPGSSDVFNGSAVVYSNASKHDILGVKKNTLKKFGAVSAECALEMAKGALKIYNADFALSVTGIAGPDGGTDLKPVGTVYFGIASRLFDNEKNYEFRKNFNAGDRANIHELTVDEEQNYAFRKNFPNQDRDAVRELTLETALRELRLVVRDFNREAD